MYIPTGEEIVGLNHSHKIENINGKSFLQVGRIEEKKNMVITTSFDQQSLTDYKISGMNSDITNQSDRSTWI